MTEKKWMLEYYGGAVGMKITAVGVSEDGFPFLVGKKGGETYRLEVSMDEEGNGPGFLFGLPMPQHEEVVK